MEMNRLNAKINEIRMEYMEYIEGNNDEPSNLIKNPIPCVISYEYC